MADGGELALFGGEDFGQEGLGTCGVRSAESGTLNRRTSNLEWGNGETANIPNIQQPTANGEPSNLERGKGRRETLKR